jgi:hypothetical protein
MPHDKITAAGRQRMAKTGERLALIVVLIAFRCSGRCRRRYLHR